MPSGPWRPANLTDLTRKDSAHVVNQLFRETNIRIDNVVKAQQPTIRGNAVLNFGTIGAQSCVERPVNMLGVNQNHVPHVSPITAIGSNLSWSSYVKSNNVVAIRICNASAGAIAANTIQWKVVAQ